MCFFMIFYKCLLFRKTQTIQVHLSSLSVFSFFVPFYKCQYDVSLSVTSASLFHFYDSYIYDSFHSLCCFHISLTCFTYLYICLKDNEMLLRFITGEYNRNVLLILLGFFPKDLINETGLTSKICVKKGPKTYG